jgi:hypothetical protein
MAGSKGKKIILAFLFICVLLLLAAVVITAVL